MALQLYCKFYCKFRPSGKLCAKIEKSMGFKKLTDLDKMQNGFDLQVCPHF